MAGVTGSAFTSAYVASNFAVEGWMKSLEPEVQPFGIKTMIVEPGFFGTALLSPESTTYAEPTVADYAREDPPYRRGLEADERPAGR